MAMYEQWFEQDLGAKAAVRHCESVTFTGDGESNMIGVRVFLRGEPIDSTGLSVEGNAIRADGTTVPLEGDISYNEATVELPATALAIAGALGVYINLTDGHDKRITIFAGVFTVVATSTDAVIDSGEIIPSITALIAELEQKIAYLDRLENVAITCTALAPDASATASVTQTEDTTTFNFGIPRGQTGATGETGATGATPEFSIGTVTTLEPGDDATATITGTAAAPVLNLGIPQGAKGDTGAPGPSISIDDDDVSTATSWSSSKIDTELTGIGNDIAAKLDASAVTSGTTTECSWQRIGIFVIAWGSVSVSSSEQSYPTAHNGLFYDTPAISVQWAKTGSYATGDWGVPKVFNQTANGFAVRTGTTGVSGHSCRWIAVGFAPQE